MTAPPTRWPKIPLAEVAEVQGGIQKQKKRTPTKNKFPFLRVANVLRGQLDLREIHEIELFEGELDRFRLQTGDLLVVEGNGSPEQIGRAAIWNGSIQDCVHQNHLIRVRPRPAINARYLEFVWNSPQVSERLRSIAGSTNGLYTLNTSKIKSMQIPLPTRAEQSRIVDALDAHLSRLEKITFALKRALVNLESLREAAALSAFAALQDYPSRTAEDRLDKLAEAVVDCEHSTAKFVKSGYPCIDTTCIRPGQLIREKLRFVSQETYAHRTRRLVPREGDIVFAREGTVGTAVALPGDLEACLGQRVVIIRPGLHFVPKFLEHYLNSYRVRRQWQSQLLGTTAAHLNVRDIKALIVMQPPRDVQLRVAADLEVIDRGARRFRAAIQNLQLRAQHLRQSLFSAAFSGHLTPALADGSYEYSTLEGWPTNEAKITNARNTGDIEQEELRL